MHRDSDWGTSRDKTTSCPGPRFVPADLANHTWNPLYTLFLNAALLIAYNSLACYLLRRFIADRIVVQPVLRSLPSHSPRQILGSLYLVIAHSKAKSSFKINKPKYSSLLRHHISAHVNKRNHQAR